jgi:hypothetical protein
MESYGAEFGDWLANINGNDRTIGFIIAALVVVLVFRSSAYTYQRGRVAGWKLLIAAAIAGWAIISTLTHSSEVFLYFNF